MAAAALGLLLLLSTRLSAAPSGARTLLRGSELARDAPSSGENSAPRRAVAPPAAHTPGAIWTHRATGTTGPR